MENHVFSDILDLGGLTPGPSLIVDLSIPAPKVPDSWDMPEGAAPQRMKLRGRIKNEL